MNRMIDAYRGSQASSAEYASPHQLITMLFEGAMERISRAIGHLERDEIAAKGECLNRATGIIDHLRHSLNGGAGDGEVAGNLDALYDYMLQRLTEANLRNDSAVMVEVRDLLAQLRDGWVGIPQEQREPAVSGSTGVKVS